MDGKTLPHYEIISQGGGDGIAEVYQVKDLPALAVIPMHRYRWLLLLFSKGGSCLLSRQLVRFC